MNKGIISIAITSIILIGCHPKKNIASPDNATVEATAPKEEQLPKVQPVYNASEKRENDLLHTKLEVSFDWKERQLFGKAALLLKPYARPVDSLILDAKAMDIHKVTIAVGESNYPDVKYKYDGWSLRIKLPRTMKKTEQYQVFINYTANPEKVEQKGSSAISEAKGLYFINHDGSNPKKHQEIWTQGETESSSTWFPTIDAPNEKTTQEMFITVKNNFQTLSNGTLISSKENDNGTRTDYWKMDLPHAPYLFMMGIGEYAIVKDTWTRKDGTEMEVNYYVEKEYEKYARDIFGKTPKMIQYFSDLLGVEYPWAKYSQIVGRDYVSGAMENTTATLHGEFLYQTKRELIDSDNESIIAHELFHHWFGDLVTCESWSNLPLNESFANYSQFLWDEGEHGKMEADKNAYAEMDGYFLSAQQGGHNDMIRFDYASKEDMFDGHSYNKGGRILHMLRTHLGDEIFFDALKNYLTDNAYTSTEIHELRMQFEKASGEDLNWFFNQWFLASGHPKVKITQNFDDVSKELTVSINQTQDFEKWPLYQLPIQIDIYTNGSVRTEKVWVRNELNDFTFKLSQALDLVNVDATKTTLWLKKDAKSIEQWIYQLNNAPLWLDKKEALEKLEKSSNPDAIAAIMKSLDHEFYDIKLMAISSLDEAVKSEKEKVKSKLARMYQNDAHPKVRKKSIEFLVKHFPDAAFLNPLFEKGFKDESLEVLGATLKGYAKLNGVEGLAKAKEFENEESSTVQLAVAAVYAEHGTVENHDFFTNNVNELNGMNQFGFLSSYFKFLQNQDDETAAKGISVFTDVIEGDGIWYARLAGYQLLTGLQTHFGNRISEIDNELASLEKEGNPDPMKAAQLEKNKILCKNKEQEIGAKLKVLTEKETDENLLKYLPRK
jgi:aminopeptidase N